MIVYETYVRPCDVAIWVRMDFYSHYETDQCTGANHWLNLDAHAPPDHGGHVYNDRGDVGNYSWVALTGKYDSGDILAPDDNLEKTGTYALCFARHNGEPNCTTWVPHPDNYTFMPDVQIHIWHKPPSMPPPSRPPPKIHQKLKFQGVIYIIFMLQLFFIC